MKQTQTTMKLDKRTERRIIDEVQDSYDMDNPFNNFSCRLDFGTFNLYVYEIYHILYADVERKSDGQIFENISNYIEKELLDKYIKLD